MCHIGNMLVPPGSIDVVCFPKTQYNVVPKTGLYLPITHLIGIRIHGALLITFDETTGMPRACTRLSNIKLLVTFSYFSEIVALHVLKLANQVFSNEDVEFTGKLGVNPSYLCMASP